MLWSSCFTPPSSRLPDAIAANRKLVGTWRYEDEDNIEELTLNPDRSFRSVTSYKQILATPSVPTEIGTWQMQGNQIAFDATLTFDKTKRQFKRMLSEVKKDSFVMMNLGDRKTVTYKRFSLPTCTGSTVSDTQSMREGDVLGLWEYITTRTTTSFALSRIGVMNCSALSTASGIHYTKAIGVLQATSSLGSRTSDRMLTINRRQGKL